VSFLVDDHLGSTVATWTQAAGNQPAATQAYFPFGAVRAAGGIGTDHTYTGQIADAATGLMYYRARYYDPQVGRFVSADTIVPHPADPQDLNRYSYVRNNPTNYTDPSGHWPWGGGCVFGKNSDGSCWGAQETRGVVGGLADMAPEVATAFVVGAVCVASGATGPGALVFCGGAAAVAGGAAERATSGGSVWDVSAMLEDFVIGAAASAVAVEASNAYRAVRQGIRNAFGRTAAPAVNANSADDLLGQARVARDELADQAGSRVATVTGGYDSATGRVVAGCSGPGFCAEDDVLRQLVELGSDPANVRFTEAIRPRTGLEVPVCVSCQANYFPEQFPASVLFQPGGKWGVR
jgi:RHS repeat-associated protein